MRAIRTTLGPPLLTTCAAAICEAPSLRPDELVVVLRGLVGCASSRGARGGTASPARGSGLGLRARSDTGSGAATSASGWAVSTEATTAAAAGGTCGLDRVGHGRRRHGRRGIRLGRGRGDGRHGRSRRRHGRGTGALTGGQGRQSGSAARRAAGRSRSSRARPGRTHRLDRTAIRAAEATGAASASGIAGSGEPVASTRRPRPPRAQGASPRRFGFAFRPKLISFFQTEAFASGSEVGVTGARRRFDRRQRHGLRLSLPTEADLLLPDRGLGLRLGRCRLRSLLRPDGLRLRRRLRLPAEADLLLPDRGLVALAHVSSPPAVGPRRMRWMRAAFRPTSRAGALEQADQLVGVARAFERDRLSRPFRAGRDRRAPAPSSACLASSRSASPSRSARACAGGSGSGRRSPGAGSRAPRRGPGRRPSAASVWVTTPSRLAASCARIWPCCSAGKTSMMRSIVSAAPRVCSVAKTRCPVSAAVSAVEIVSRSRISPTRITSGSWRRPARSASANPSVSVPTSRWLTRQRRWLWRNSIGSSIVRMWPARLRLISSISAASVVDLPEPVGPGDEDEPARLVGELVQSRPAGPVLEREDLVRDQAEDGGDRVPLEEDVDAEPGDAGDRVREVDLPVDLEALLLLGVEDAVEELLGVVRRQLRQLLEDGHFAAHA